MAVSRQHKATHAAVGQNITATNCNLSHTLRETIMALHRVLYALTTIAPLIFAPLLAAAQTSGTLAASTPNPSNGAGAPMPGKASVKVEVVPSLFVMNARGATLEGQTLTLTGVSPNSITFADRPVRAAGHLLTRHLLEEWSVGSFAKDPPNATVSVVSKDGASAHDAVVVLREPHLDGDRLTFDVRVLEGNLAGADGPAAGFVDIIGLPFTPLSVAGVARRSARPGPIGMAPRLPGRRHTAIRMTALPLRLITDPRRTDDPVSSGWS